MELANAFLTALRAIVLIAVATILAACAAPATRRSELHLDAEGPPPAGNIPPPVQLSPALPRPRPQVRQETYTVVVNRVNVSDLLFALARDAKINVDISPGITGLVTLNAVDQTLPQLLSRIASQVEMRWEIQDSRVIVEPDRPFWRTYKIDYPNMERRVVTSVVASSDVGASAGGGGGGGGGAGGASGGAAGSGGTRINIGQVNAFWTTLERNIEDLTREEDRRALQRTAASGAIIAAAAAQSPPPSAPGAPTAPAPTSPAAPAQGAAPSPAPVAAPLPGAQLVRYVIANPEAGVLLVNATSRVHEQIQKYLDQLLPRIKRQVLIEATIVEVQLNNEYQRGIDWSLLRRGPNGLSLTQAASGSTPAGVNSSLFICNLSQQANLGSLATTVRLLESFGTVRVLSSPKLSVLNNQTAILKVVDNRVYFTISASTSQNQTSSLTAFTTNPNVVSVGFVMNVTPQISDSHSVLLNLRPSISRIVSFVSDPNPSLPAGVVNRVPEVQTREMESMISVESGQTAIMGGLIQDSISDVEDTVPGLSDVPFFGSIFSNRNRGITKNELVIFIQPIVVIDASVDGDYREFRSSLPDRDFISRPNPGKPINIQ